ncbi:MAG: DNA-directed RNA polymerase subunit beta, partial [Oscillospiraceae bacterium]
MVNVKPVQLGTNTRMSFAKINEVLEMPNLIEVQKNSYEWFVKQGLKEVFSDVSAITDYTGNLVLDFVGYRLDDQPKYSVAECKDRDVTYAAPLRVTARLLNKESGEVKEQEIFMGDFPKMTESGTFVINGAERVIVSQLVRSPGVYFSDSYDKTGKKLYTSTINPNRGAWLEYETDSNDFFYVRIDKNRKIPISAFVRALLKVRDDVSAEDISSDFTLGLTSSEGSDAEVYGVLGEDERVMATITNKDATKNGEEALLEVYRKLRPGEPPTIESAVKHIVPLLFDERRYDLSKVGRYKYNKKLSIENRLVGQTLAEPIIDMMTGEVIAEAEQKLTREVAVKIQRAGVDTAYVYVNEGEKVVKIISNGMVDIAYFIPGIDKKECGINEMVRFKVLMDIFEKAEDEEQKLEMIKKRANELVPRHIIKDDIFASINYMNNIVYGVGNVDDIDHLGNRRIRTVGELLQNQFRIGFSRMERVIRERMSLQAQDMDVVTPQALINIRPVVASIKEFFGSSPLSQFMDQTNPLAELTHKRRLSALGPGGLSRDRAGFEVRDVHYSHYGRMCPIETPEGPNIGLISYLASFARLNDYGFIEAPYRKVDKTTGVISEQVEYMTADVEDNYVVAQANEPITEDSMFERKRVNARRRGEILEIDRESVDFMDVSPKMVVSVATSMIPFLENDDANRALMGANMQRQAVPLLRTEAPIIGTGMEYKAAVDSGVVLVSKHTGTIERVSADEIVIKDENGRMHQYKVTKFKRSNQGTCTNQRPIVTKGQPIKAGEVLADGPATADGEISLGKNALIGFMTWEGYNYEDAVLINEKIVRDDVYTSIHIEEYETEARDTKLGPEEITRDIPNVGEDALKDLDENGIIRIGAEVRSGDILVGKVTPKGETELTAEERLLRAIFGEKAREVRDTSLKVPHGECGIIVDVKVFTRGNCDELSPGVNMV